MNSRIPFLIIVAALLGFGFVVTTLISYSMANDSLNDHIRSNSLPLTSDNIYSEIQRDLLQPILVSSLMAQDTFVRDWTLKGEKDPENIVRYLTSIQKKYQAVTAFFVSDKSHIYYHSSGIVKTISKDKPEDGWYFRVEENNDDYEINLDIDSANPLRTTFFVNHKVLNFENEFLGVIGVGLASEVVVRAIESYQVRYGRKIYFSDRQGNIMLHGLKFNQEQSLHEIKGIDKLANEILSGQGGSYSYQNEHGEVFLKVRFVPDLDWYLLVEQEQQVSRKVSNALWINLAISLAITLLILGFTLRTVNRYQTKITKLASLDQLTQTTSRNNFEHNFKRLLRNANRQQQPLSIILVDIDHFKRVNDRLGHLAGDKVLAEVAKSLSFELQKSDVICRWGGEEFLIALPNHDLSVAHNIAEKKRAAIESNMSAVNGSVITASFGVAQLQDDESSERLFNRADKALYRAKSLGRNRVELALL